MLVDFMYTCTEFHNWHIPSRRYPSMCTQPLMTAGGKQLHLNVDVTSFHTAAVQGGNRCLGLVLRLHVLSTQTITSTSIHTHRPQPQRTRRETSSINFFHKILELSSCLHYLIPNEKSNSQLKNYGVSKSSNCRFFHIMCNFFHALFVLCYDVY